MGIQRTRDAHSKILLVVYKREEKEKSILKILSYQIILSGRQ
jgi:hypothetical protein